VADYSYLGRRGPVHAAIPATPALHDAPSAAPTCAQHVSINGAVGSDLVRCARLSKVVGELLTKRP